MVGGGTGQFAAIPLNLLRSGGKAVYLNTGLWSSKAAKEASKYGHIIEIKPDLGTLSEIKWDLDPDVSYFYYCSNETVHGIELPSFPETHGIPLVADMSSNILTKEFDITKVLDFFFPAKRIQIYYILFSVFPGICWGPEKYRSSWCNFSNYS